MVEGATARDLREKALGMFFAGEVWRLGRNVTVLEMGCGNGQVTYNLNTVPGVNCLGLDGYKGIRSLGDNYRQWNLERYFPAHADYVISFEVAEHIAPEFEDNFVRTLAQAKVAVLVSWAFVGQSGHGHVNEHTQSYVIRRLERENFRYCPALSHQLVQGFARGFFREWEWRNLVVMIQNDAEEVACDLPLREFAQAELLALALLSLVLATWPWLPKVKLSARAWAGSKVMAD